MFLTDLSRAIPIAHGIDFVELAGYNGADTGRHSRVRLLKDTAIPVTGHDVLLVEDVVDTGLTLNYLRKLFDLRQPASLRVTALLDRPYRRLRLPDASSGRRDRKSTRLNSSHRTVSRMPSSA